MPNTNTMPLRVDIERIKSDILALAAIWKNDPDRGTYRMAFIAA
jgi:hypothetical protein